MALAICLWEWSHRDFYLEEEGRGCAGEVEALEHVRFGVVLAAVALDHHSLGRTLKVIHYIW